VAIFFAIGGWIGTANPWLELALCWSDDGTTIPFATDDNLQQSDFNIGNQSDGTFYPKPYIQRYSSDQGNLAINTSYHLVYPVQGGVLQCMVRASVINIQHAVWAQRLVI
jgi:hypothetical protein